MGKQKPLNSEEFTRVDRPEFEETTPHPETPEPYADRSPIEQTANSDSREFTPQDTKSNV